MGNHTTQGQTKKHLKTTKVLLRAEVRKAHKLMSSVDYFERRLDGKRRLTVPSELRKEFASGEVVVTRGFGKYLHLYTKEVWQSQVEPRMMGDVLDERVADLNVRFRMGKQVAVMDQKQGRVTLEQHLLDYAGIERDLVAVRVGTYWRLMSKEMATD